MVNTYGSSRKVTHTWLHDPLDYNVPSPSTNRFLPLADMPSSLNDLPPSRSSALSHHRKKKATTRRKRYSRGSTKRLVDMDDVDLARSVTASVWEEAPETYVPHLGVTIHEAVTLDSLPRASPPVTFRTKKRPGKRRQYEEDGEDGDLVDWDVVSNCSEESFCMV